jgi:hypothetical protein
MLVRKGSLKSNNKRWCPINGRSDPHKSDQCMSDWRMSNMMFVLPWRLSKCKTCPTYTKMWCLSNCKKCTTERHHLLWSHRACSNLITITKWSHFPNRLFGKIVEPLLKSLCSIEHINRITTLSVITFSSALWIDF